MKIRISVILLTVIMVLALLPTAALADEAAQTVELLTDQDAEEIIFYFRLTFVTNGGTEVKSQVRERFNVIDLAGYTTTRAGFIFAGWYADPELTVPVTEVKMRKNYSVYAKWTPWGTVDHFELDLSKYTSFLDIPNRVWYSDDMEGSVRTAAQLGLMTGYGNGDFGPEDELKRSEAIKLAAVIYSIYTGDGFDFTQGEPWYQVYIDYAVEKGIIKADDFDDFTAVCTRAEAAYILSRALPDTELAAICERKAPDVADGDEYAASIRLLYAAGVLRGSDEAGTFGGDGSFTRAQAAAIASRLCLPETRFAA